MTSASSEKTGYENHVPDRNLAMELVRVTEAAAIAAGHWVGAGDKNSADGAAVDAMRAFLTTVNFDGVIVTDALNMKAVTQSAKGSETVTALAAGLLGLLPVMIETEPAMAVSGASGGARLRAGRPSRRRPRK